VRHGELAAAPMGAAEVLWRERFGAMNAADLRELKCVRRFARALLGPEASHGAWQRGAASRPARRRGAPRSGAPSGLSSARFRPARRAPPVDRLERLGIRDATSGACTGWPHKQLIALKAAVA
jgi:hypothetical protein